MPISRDFEFERAVAARRVMDLDQHIHAERKRQCFEFAAPRRRTAQAMISRMQSAPQARASSDLIGIEHEILAQYRQSQRLRAPRRDNPSAPWKYGLVGQHREAGRAAVAIGAGQGGRIEIGADQAVARARPS